MNKHRFLAYATYLLAAGSLTACTPWQRSLSSNTRIDNIHHLAAVDVSCPPPGKIVERDLTVLWAHRRYLLSNGQVCCPVMADNTAACAATVPPLPNAP